MRAKYHNAGTQCDARQLVFLSMVMSCIQLFIIKQVCCSLLYVYHETVVCILLPAGCSQRPDPVLPWQNNRNDPFCVVVT